MALATVTLAKTLQRAGLQRIKARQQQAAAPRRFGYQSRHRAGADTGRYGSCLTDAEWVLDLFEPPQGRHGCPPKYDRRSLLDACLLGTAQWLRLADAAEGLSAMAGRAKDLQPLGGGRQVRAVASGAAHEVASTPAEPSAAGIAS